jgi:hypothetical protein
MRQQKILWGIEQEWLRKEKSYIEQLEKMDQQLSYISATNIQKLIHQLISVHKDVCKEIEYLYERDHHPSNLTKQLTRSIEVLVCTYFSFEIFLDIMKKNFCLDANTCTL